MTLFLQSAYLSSAMSLLYIALLVRSNPHRRLPLVPVLTTFVAGMMGVVLVVLLVRIIPELSLEGIAGRTVITPIVEESAKFLVFALTVRRLRYPNLIEPLDYAVFF